MDKLQKNSDEVNYFKGNKAIRIGQNPYPLEETKIMGIVNLTDDSFFNESRISSDLHLLKKAETMLKDGASFLDLGAYSTRPGAIEITEELERERIVKATQKIQANFPNALISIDTFRASVARAAFDCGAHLINDVSGGDLDEHMFDTVLSLDIPFIAMHMRGNPQTMQSQTDYVDVTKEVLQLLNFKAQRLEERGFDNLILDPGIGFAKTVDQNFELLRNIDQFSQLKQPILVGISRKSFIQKTLSVSVEEALNGTTALHSYLALKKVDILRVHDVKEAKQTVDLVRSFDL